MIKTINLVDYLIKCNEISKNKIIYTFLSNGNETNVTYGHLFNRAMTIGGFLQMKYKKGDRIILALKPGMDFVESFFGCLFAGLIPVPLYPPFSNAFIRKIDHVIKDASPKAFITSADLFEAGKGLGWAYDSIDIVLNESFDGQSAGNWIHPAITGHDIAFLQYTSGSTNDPKGVMVSHLNIVNNENMIKVAFEQKESAVGVGWLPLYHDMGLIGNILQPFYSGYRFVIMSPLDFLADPLLWLEVITTYKGTISGGPNFAYDLCVRKYDENRCKNLDLSSWDLAFNGAEPVRRNTLELFSDLYSNHGFKNTAFCPCYGLAENTLFCSSVQKNDPYKFLHVMKDDYKDGKITICENDSGLTTSLVSSGKCSDEQTISIIDPETFETRDDGLVGEIWIKGQSVAKGYWNREELSNEMFNAFSVKGDGPYLRTGDLGFIHEGELYISGRLKDLIIIRGRNYHPQDIELTVESVSTGIRPGRVAAFMVEDDLVIAAELSRDLQTSEENLLKDIYHNIKREHELNPADIVLVSSKGLPVTTSGKIRRKSSKQLYIGGKLPVICSYRDTCGMNEKKAAPNVNADDLRYSLIHKFSSFFNLLPEEMDVDEPFGNYGLTSSEAIELTDELSRITGQSCVPTLFYDFPTINKLISFFTGGTDKTAIRLNFQKKEGHVLANDIAIIGACCRFPGAEGLDKFWDVLENGKDCISGFPDDIRKPYLNKAKGNYAKCGGFISDIDAFDAPFFQINTKEARLMDPQHRLFLETVWHTFENAGYAPGKLSGKDIGVFVGVSSFDYYDVIREAGLEPEAYITTGLAHTMIANRISYILNFHGPSEAIDTACSSSLVAVHRAISSIRQGDCQMAIAGGVNIMISHESFTSLGRSGFLSSRGRCSTFDRNADGYVRSEGTGAVLLKPLEDAIRDGDHIHAVIKGSAVSHGGKTESLTAPGTQAQAGLIMKAMAKAGVPADSIGYIETHGTGTVLGDPIEINGLLTAYRELYHDAGKEFSSRSCAIGSVKSNIGHLESAAGIAGLIKIMQCLEKKTMVPTLHVRDQNPLIAIEHSPFYINTEKKTWTALEDGNGNVLPRRAGISSFGFGGSYAHLVLEEFVNHVTEITSEDHLIVLSSQSYDGLVEMAVNLNRWLQDEENGDYVKQGLYDLACTLAEGRDHFNVRLAVIAGSKAELTERIGRFIETKEVGNNLFFAQCEKCFYEEVIYEKDLAVAAEKWVNGAQMDWDVLRNGASYKKLPLPGYVFEKKRYFAVDSALAAASPLSVDRRNMTSGESGETLMSYEEIVIFLKNEVSVIIGSDPAEINPETRFDDFGMDSISVISIVNGLEKRTGIEIPPSAVHDYRNIDSLARFAAGGAKEEARPEIDLLRDTELDEFIFIKGTPKARTQNKAVFLTGSTGYLGSYLLQELLCKTDADIYCLVRAEDESNGLERIRDACIRHGSSADLDSRRIHVIPGDLGEWRLGLERKEFNRLCGIIDTIWHCGATVDWMKPYEALKKVNVDGTHEIIRMASSVQIKTIHFISSLAVLPLDPGKNEWFEMEVENPRGITAGYGQSKWVSEQLCLKARKFGIPVSVYRFDYVAGKPGSGTMKESDFIARLIKGCIQMGSMPLEETNFDIIPVDYLCRMLVSISSSGDKAGKIYHLINRRPFSTSDFARLIRGRGYRIRRIPFEQWKKLTKKDPKNALYPLYPFINRYTVADFESYTSWKVDNTNTMNALFRKEGDLIMEIPGADLALESVMDYLASTGYIPQGIFGEIAEQQFAYWEKQMEGAQVLTGVPIKTNRLIPDDAEKTHVRFHISGEQVKIIKEAGEPYGLNIQNSIIGTVFVLLSRYSRQDDILLAMQGIFEDQGIFKCGDPLFIRSCVKSEKSFGSLALKIKRLISEAVANNDISSDIIERILDIDGGNHYPVQFFWRKSGDVEPVDEKKGLCFIFTENTDGLEGKISYHPALYDHGMMIRMAGHVENLTHEIPQSMDKAISRLTMLSEDEREMLLVDVNRTEAPYPDTRCIHQLIREKADMKPESTALIFEEQFMSYGQLNHRTDLFSVYLNEHGIRKGDVVGIFMERSIHMMIAVIGILKSGAAYLPLDPDYPVERLSHMADDADARLIITSRKLSGHPFVSDRSVFVLDDEAVILDAMALLPDYHERLRTLDQDSDSSDMAYIIYTSGSTGKPKGVMAMHKGIVNLIHSMGQLTDFDENGTMLCITRLGFDMVKPELYLPLIRGGIMHILPLDSTRDGFLLRDFLERNRISLMQATPSSWRLLLYAGWEGNPDMTIITGGEPLPEDLAVELSGKCRKLLNMYGPTETTVWSTAAHITADSGVHIGYPVSNTRIYILDQDLNPVPVGVPGELYIGGHGVTKGYMGKPDMTRERYPVNPFTDDKEPMYKTGDLVRMRKDGALEYIERLDHQVKIRGYRIELSEIENTLRVIPGIKEAVVHVSEDQEGNKTLMAWAVPEMGDTSMDVAAIKKKLGQNLPPWMIPSRILLLSEMPLNANGKIDRKMLPLEYAGEDKCSFVSPETEIEIVLFDMWKDVLGVAGIGVTDDFADNGGDSLKAMKLLVGINETFGISMTVQLLFENLTIRKLAKTIDGILRGELVVENDIAQTMRDDAVLDIEPVKIPASVDTWGGFSQVLLTGATGYLGAYILRDLLELSSCHVHCIVRAKNDEDALNRLVSNLDAYGLWKPEYHERITPVPGDLGLSCFGLSPEQYRILSKTIDTVVHNGAMVNFSYPYGLLKKANVDGTGEILKFAVNERIKPLHYISTIGVFEVKNPDISKPVDEDGELPDPENLYYGYSQSKWVAEMLVRSYRNLDMPVTIYRPGPIYGDSRSGALNTDDFFSRMLRTCVNFNMIPDLDIRLDGVPVDHASRAIIEIALSHESAGKNFNIVNSHAITLDALCESLSEYGYDLERVSVGTWIGSVEKHAGHDQDLLAFKPLVSDPVAGTDGKTFFDMQTGLRQTYSSSNMMDFLEGTGIEPKPLTGEIFYHYIKYLEKIGLIVNDTDLEGIMCKA